MIYDEGRSWASAPLILLTGTKMSLVDPLRIVTARRDIRLVLIGLSLIKPIVHCFRYYF